MSRVYNGGKVARNMCEYFDDLLQCNNLWRDELFTISNSVLRTCNIRINCCGSSSKKTSLMHSMIDRTIPLFTRTADRRCQSKKENWSIFSHRSEQLRGPLPYFSQSSMTRGSEGRSRYTVFTHVKVALKRKTHPQLCLRFLVSGYIEIKVISYHV